MFIEIATFAVISAVFASTIAATAATIIPLVKPVSDTDRAWYLALSLNAGIVLLIAFVLSANMRMILVASPLLAFITFAAFALYFGETIATYMGKPDVAEQSHWDMIKLISFLVIYSVWFIVNGFPNPFVAHKNIQ